MQRSFYTQGPCLITEKDSMLVIILLGITLKYSNSCTFSWFLVKLVLLIKTAQLTVRGLLSRPPPRFSLREPPRATIHSGITRCPRWRGLPWSSPLSIRNWPGINNCCSHAKQPLLTCAAGLERGGEGRKRERGLGREGKGLALPFPFALFSPSPPLLSLRLFCACRAVFKTSSKKMKYLELYRKKNKSYENF